MARGRQLHEFRPSDLLVDQLHVVGRRRDVFLAADKQHRCVDFAQPVLEIQLLEGMRAANESGNGGRGDHLFHFFQQTNLSTYY